MKRQDVEAYLRRPWGLFRELRAERERSLDPKASFQRADGLRKSVARITTPEARALARRLDWEHHVRLKETIERANAGRRSRPPR